MSFHLPLEAFWQTGAAILLLLYCTYAPIDDPAPWWDPARFLRSTIAPAWVVKGAWGLVFVLHSLEGVYTAHMARKHKMPFSVAVSTSVADQWNVANHWCSWGTLVVSRFSGSLCFAVSAVEYRRRA